MSSQAGSTVVHTGCTVNVVDPFSVFFYLFSSQIRLSLILSGDFGSVYVCMTVCYIVFTFFWRCKV